MKKLTAAQTKSITNAKSQAQALRNAADDYHKDCDCTDYLRRMAGDLEAGK